MLIRDAIKYQLFIFLLIFISGYRSNFITTNTITRPETSATASNHKIAPLLDPSVPAIKREIILNNKIKVRFIGGEFACNKLAAHYIVMSPDYGENLSAGQYISYTSAYSAYLFTLRGPPAVS